MEAEAGRFLGAVEHSFVQDGSRHCEINLVFDLKVPNLDASRTPPSSESHIEFRWVSLTELSEANLQPGALCDLLPAWLEQGDALERWASTF